MTDWQPAPLRARSKSGGGEAMTGTGEDCELAPGVVYQHGSVHLFLDGTVTVLSLKQWLALLVALGVRRQYTDVVCSSSAHYSYGGPMHMERRSRLASEMPNCLDCRGSGKVQVPTLLKEKPWMRD